MTDSDETENPKQGLLPGPLIVDSDMIFLDSLKSDAKAKLITPTVSSSGKSAQLTLANTDKKFTSILVGTNLRTGYTLSVVRFAHRYRPGVPIYLLFTEDKSNLAEDSGLFNTDAQRKIGVHGVLKKPLSYAQILELLNNPSHKVDLSYRQPNFSGQADYHPADEFDSEDRGFLPISVETFLSGSVSYFDLFIKLSSGRYVKILKAGDSFGADRVSSYLKKGIKEFYLTKDSQELYMSYCDQLLSAINRSKKVAPQIQISQTLKHGDTVIKFLHSNGLSQNSIQYAASFVASVQDLVKNTRPNDNPYLNQFLQDVASYEHGVGTTVLASMMGRMIGFVSDHPAKTIGMASMFHDIGLQHLPPELRDENESKMSPEQLELFKTHPTLGATILRGFKEIEPISLQAVLQHHERKTRNGFPNRLGHGSINKVSELVGASDEFLRLIKRIEEGERFNLMEEAAKIIHSGFSSLIREAFHLVFVQKKDEIL